MRLGRGGLLIVKGADYRTGLLSQSVRRAHCVRRKGERWHARVGNTDVGETVNAEVGVDHAALRMREHRACRRGMVLGEDLASQPVFPLLISLDCGTGPGFFWEAACQRLGLTYGTSELESLA